jgi:peptidoglycan/xylan/chitin deacetylase (PgdA/CDA1 family)
MLEIVRRSIFFGLKNLATLTSGLGKDKKLFILIYHRVLDKPDFMRPGEVDIDSFDWQMALISKYFNVLPLNEAVEKMQDGKLPPRAVCITFDDGYADNLHNAAPVLNKYGLTATFFIASGYLNGGRMWNDSILETLRIIPDSKLDLSDINLGSYDLSTLKNKMSSAYAIISKIKHLDFSQRQEYTQRISSEVSGLPDDLMLNSDQLKQLLDHGMEIGGHTVNHPILATMGKSEAKKEILDNKIFLEKSLKTKIRFFAYPNGKPGEDYLPDQVEIIKDCGFEAAVSTQWGVSKKGNDFLQLPRFTPWDKRPEKFMARMAYMYISKP